MPRRDTQSFWTANNRHRNYSLGQDGKILKKSATFLQLFIAVEMSNIYDCDLIDSPVRGFEYYLVDNSGL